MTNELNNPLIDKLIKDVANIDTNSDRRETTNKTIDELLGELNAKIVTHVCGNFALRDERLPTEGRRELHNSIITEATKAIEALITEARIDELESFYTTVPEASSDWIDERITELKENK